MKVAIWLAKYAIESRVELDGVDVSSSVSGLRVDAKVGSLTTVTLTLHPTEITIEGEAGKLFARRFSARDPEAPPIDLVAGE